MAKKTYYAIKYPFTINKPENFFLDLDSDIYLAIKSNLTHLLFTPKGSKLRDPSFGTSLLNQIFQPNDSITQGDIKSELQVVVSRYFPNVTITKLNITPTDSNRGVSITMNYSIDEGNFTISDQINQQL